jgi:hypothetical protein
MPGVRRTVARVEVEVPELAELLALAVAHRAPAPAQDRVDIELVHANAVPARADGVSTAACPSS